MFERNNYQFLRGEVKRGSTAVDVGAGFGVYSRVLLRLTGTEGKVVAYEPEATNYLRCLRSLKWALPSSRLELFQMAVSSSEGFSFIEIDHSNPANHKLKIESQEGIKIETVSLDSHLSDLTDNVGFCKIDVQGHELEVLKGAMQLLKSEGCTFMIEFDSSFGINHLRGIWALMHEEGYAAFQVGKNGRLSRFILRDDFEGYRDIIFKKSLEVATD